MKAEKFLPAAAVLATVLQLGLWPWSIPLAVAIGVAAIPVGRWVDRESDRHGY